MATKLTLWCRTRVYWQGTRLLGTSCPSVTSCRWSLPHHSLSHATWDSPWGTTRSPDQRGWRLNISDSEKGSGYRLPNKHAHTHTQTYNMQNRPSCVICFNWVRTPQLFFQWLRQGRVLFKRTCSVDCNLPSILSNLSLWKRTKWSVVIETWSWSGKPAASLSARAGLRSCRVAGSKHRALAFYSLQFCYVLLVSMCRGESDLGLCMTLKLAERMRLLSADFWFRNVFGLWIRRKSALRSRILIASSKVMPGSRSDSPLHFDFKNRYPANLYKQIIG